MEWTTLVATVLGAVIATGSTLLVERGRRKREREDKVSAVLRDLYGEYLAALSQARHTFGNHTSSRGSEPSSRGRDSHDAFAPCYPLRQQLTITAPAETVRASDAAFRALRTLRDLTVAGSSKESGEYREANACFLRELEHLHAAMRADLGIACD
ncbi:hypothetical protein ACFW1M_15505 [Streptomyces inhibens]|uniref:hypothetical protein n=1 Tax=Streptomyces inhibens TaxID=2293571 RepID=UPI00367473D7